MNYVEINQSYS